MKEIDLLDLPPVYRHFVADTNNQVLRKKKRKRKPKKMKTQLCYGRADWSPSHQRFDTSGYIRLPSMERLQDYPICDPQEPAQYPNVVLQLPKPEKYAPENMQATQDVHHIEHLPRPPSKSRGSKSQSRPAAPASRKKEKKESRRKYEPRKPQQPDEHVSRRKSSMNKKNLKELWRKLSMVVLDAEAAHSLVKKINHPLSGQADASSAYDLATTVEKALVAQVKESVQRLAQAESQGYRSTFSNTQECIQSSGLKLLSTLHNKYGLNWEAKPVNEYSQSSSSRLRIQIDGTGTAFVGEASSNMAAATPRTQAFANVARPLSSRPRVASRIKMSEKR